MATKKIIDLGKSFCQVSDLIEALARCNDDSKVSFKLHVNEPVKKQDTEAYKLRNICSMLHMALTAAKRCVDACAEQELASGHMSIYYDRLKGYNGGAQDVQKVVEDVLNDYEKEMIQIDLANG